MRSRLFVLVVLGLLVIALGSGCPRGEDYWDDQGGDPEVYFDPTLPTGTLEFTASIMDLTDIRSITPLGNLNPPGHTIPTDHIYFLTTGMQKPVYAPASGKILKINACQGADEGIKIGVTNSMSYYLAHIFLDDRFMEGGLVVAGEQLGLSGNAAAVDLGVMRQDVGNAFINTNYPAQTQYGDKPLFYYSNSEGLQDTLYDLVMPPDDSDYTTNPLRVRDGQFVFDQPGTLIGNWFLDGTTAYLAEEQLSFAYDNFYTDQIRIAIGREKYFGDSIFGYQFLAVSNDQPELIRPEAVTVAQGAIAYHLYNANNTLKGEPAGARVGLMMVQMLSDSQVRIELFNDVTSDSRPFTSGAWVYER